MKKLGRCEKLGAHNKDNFLAAKILELLHTCENHDFMKAFDFENTYLAGIITDNKSVGNCIGN